MKAAQASFLSAAIASTCCVVPLLLVLAGVGTFGLSAKFAQYDWLFAIVGMSLLALSYRRYFRERRRCASNACEMQGKGFTQFSLFFSTLVILFIVGMMGFSHLSVSSGGASVTNGEPVETTSSVTPLPRQDLTHLAVNAQQMTLEVDGMTCASCAWGAEASLERVPGVVSAKISFREKKAVIQYKPQEISTQQLVEAVNQLGYTAHLPPSTSAGM